MWGVLKILGIVLAVFVVLFLVMDLVNHLKRDK